MYWIMELSSVCNKLERYSLTLYFWKSSWNIDAFYYTTKTVYISVFTDFSQSSLFAMWNGNPIKRVEEFLQSPNRSSARWRYFIATTRNLQGFAFLCKLELLLFKLRWDYKNEKNGMTSLSNYKWPIIGQICKIDKWFNINYLNACCQIMKMGTLI